MTGTKHFYFGVYIDHWKETATGEWHKDRIAQLTDTVDGLSCEMLANPGLIDIYCGTKAFAIKEAKRYAQQHNCIKLEINLDKYREINIDIQKNRK